MNHNEYERLRAQFDSLQEQYAEVCRDRDALRECAALFTRFRARGA